MKKISVLTMAFALSATFSAHAANLDLPLRKAAVFNKWSMYCAGTAKKPECALMQAVADDKEQTKFVKMGFDVLPGGQMRMTLRVPKSHVDARNAEILKGSLIDRIPVNFIFEQGKRGYHPNMPLTQECPQDECEGTSILSDDAVKDLMKTKEFIVFLSVAPGAGYLLELDAAGLNEGIARLRQIQRGRVANP